jgi:hypothetical protein
MQHHGQIVRWNAHLCEAYSVEQSNCGFLRFSPNMIYLDPTSLHEFLPPGSLSWYSWYGLVEESRCVVEGKLS